MKFKFSIFVLAMTVLSVSNLNAQQELVVRDVGLWTGVGYERIFSDYRLSLTQEIRLFDNFSKIDDLVSDIGFAYKINSNFRIGTNIRYTADREDDTSYSNDIRYNFDFRFKTALFSDFTLRYRLRYQQLFGNLITLDRDENEDIKTNFRNKLQIDYVYKKHLFYISTELFREYEFNRTPYFDKIRFYLGEKIEYQRGELNFSLAYERELNASYPMNFWFARIYYTFITSNEN